MKLWAGRFQKQTDELVNDFNASISFDQRLYKQDITGSMAHAQMLCDCGILTAQDNEKIQQGLTELLAEIEAGKVTFTADNEDIHMNVETLLTAKIGDAGKRLHTARSRNDQVALDFRLYLREEISGVLEKLLQLEKVLCEKAKAHTQTVMPGSKLAKANRSDLDNLTGSFPETNWRSQIEHAKKIGLGEDSYELIRV